MSKQIEVLFENEMCLVFNKPAGLAVQGGAGVSNSLDSILMRDFSPRPLLVHRLDMDTSGVILVAKDKNSAACFSRILEEGTHITKQYLAVCAGAPERMSGVIHLDIDVHGKSKRSKTLWTALRTGSFPPSAGLDLKSRSYGGIFSVMELKPGTGRMHQLRRHMALTNTPILGDGKYGDFYLNKILKKTMKLKHLLLHAFSLRIPFGLGVPPLDVQAPLPAHFQAFLEQTNCAFDADYS